MATTGESSATPKSTDEDDDESAIVVYVIPGSQFAFKILAALQSRKIHHFVFFVPLRLEERKKVLPSGGTLVPEIKVGTGESAVVLEDSEKILHWIDEHRNAGLFPTEEASELSARANDTKLAGLVWYYNWVHPTAYARTSRKVFRNFLPVYLKFWLPDFFVDWYVSDAIAKYRKQAAKAIGVDDAVLNDETRMKDILVEELKYLQSFLKEPSQDYLLPGTTVPTAPDFSVYAQIDRLVGTGSDIYVDPAIPELRNDKTFGLERLWQWYDLMRERFPVQFKGKRPPKHLISTA